MNQENQFDTKKYNFTHYVGISFNNAFRAYYFGVENIPLVKGDKVVVETVRGMELGVVAYEMIPIANYKSELALKPVLRKATDVDIRLYENNLKDAQIALEICKTEANNLNLNMNLISCEYTLDKSKVIFAYLADDRVDFRELLKVLASKLHTRIELRQIGSRDKAKMIGGIGMCGLPLCCATFLNEFDNISINRAKNQMLAINIPKLSGHCGKLLCCLKYEDDAYTELKLMFPDLGAKVFIDKEEFTVTSINVISKTVTLQNSENTKVLSLSEFKKQTGYRRKEHKKNEEN